MYDFIFNSRYEISLVKILEIIWEDLSIEAAQQPGRSKQEIFNKIATDLSAKRSFVVQKSDVVFYAIPDSPWVARVHLFTSSKNYFIRNRIEAGEELTRYIFRNTPLEKLYGVTSNKKFLALAKYAKWKPGHEGVLSKSYKTVEGDMIDQYVISVNRSEFMK